MYIHMWIHTHKHTQQTTGERLQTMHQDLSPISFITLKKVTPVVDSKGKMQEKEDKQSGLTVIRTHSALPEVRRGQHVPNVFSLRSSGFWTERDKILLVRHGELMAWKQKGHKWWASAEFSSEENRSSKKEDPYPWASTRALVSGRTAQYLQQPPGVAGNLQRSLPCDSKLHGSLRASDAWTRERLMAVPSPAGAEGALRTSPGTESPPKREFVELYDCELGIENMWSDRQKVSVGTLSENVI